MAKLCQIERRYIHVFVKGIERHYKIKKNDFEPFLDPQGGPQSPQHLLSLGSLRYFFDFIVSIFWYTITTRIVEQC